MFDNLTGSSLDRRSFLRGSAMFAAAIGLAVALRSRSSSPAAAEAGREAGRREEEGRAAQGSVC